MKDDVIEALEKELDRIKLEVKRQDKISKLAKTIKQEKKKLKKGGVLKRFKNSYEINI